jgi:hypothetical protein
MHQLLGAWPGLCKTIHSSSQPPGVSLDLLFSVLPGPFHLAQNRCLLSFLFLFFFPPFALSLLAVFGVSHLPSSFGDLHYYVDDISTQTFGFHFSQLVYRTSWVFLKHFKFTLGKTNDFLIVVSLPY